MEFAKRFVLTVASVLVLPTVSISAQQLLWSDNYGGLYNDGGYACLQTNDSNYVVAGSTYSFGAGDHDFYLVKLTAFGDVLWSRTYGGAGTEYGRDMVATADGGYVLVGSTTSSGAGGSDVFLVRVDSSGYELWSKTYGGAANDVGWSLRSTSDGGLIICGTTSSSGAGFGDMYLIRTDASGNVLWSRTFGGPGGESGVCVRPTADGGFVAVGSTGSFGEGYSSVYIARMTADGDSVWAGTYGGAGADFGYSVTVANDNGFIIAGATAPAGAGYSDAYLIKTDSTGLLEWEETYGGGEDDRAYAVTESGDGGYVLSGITSSFGHGKVDVYVVKTNPIGQAVWQETYGGSQSDYSRAIVRESGNDLFLVGYSYSYSSGGSDLYTLKIEGNSPTPVLDPVVDALPGGFALEQNYPNPFNSTTTIRFSLPTYNPVQVHIYNLLGRRVREWNLAAVPAGTYELEWDGANASGLEVASGVYFYRITAGPYTASKKMLLLK